MATLSGRLRLRLLAPMEEDVRFGTLGLPAAPTSATRWLERVPAAVVRGFRGAIDGSSLAGVGPRAAGEPPELRGFHHEGAVMAACVVDAMDPFGGGRARDLLTGPARSHVLLGWIGVGFALAKLPRPVWSRAVPDLDDVDHQAVLSTLAVDGWAFDLAFHDHDRWLGRRADLPEVAWRGDTADTPRIADHGLGRALWFAHGGDVDAVTRAVTAFPAIRRPDLWAGVGLAATLAGGAAADALAWMRREGDAPELALGSVLAAHAADEACADHGVLPDHVVVATRALAAADVRAASALVVGNAPGPRESDPREYLRWRARIRVALTASPSLRAG